MSDNLQFGIAYVLRDMFTQNAAKIEGSYAALSRMSGEAAKKLEAAHDKMFAGLKVMAAGAAITGAFVPAIAASAQFEQAMTEVGTITDKETLNMRAMTDEVTRMSNAYASMPVDTAKALYQAISAGYTKQAEALQIMDSAGRLAVAGFTDQKTAFEALAASMKPFKIEMSETEKISDKLFETVRIGKVELRDLGAYLNRVTPQAALANMKLDELLGSLATITAETQAPAAEAVTQVASLTRAIMEGADKVRLIEKKFRIKLDFDASVLKQKGLVNFIGDLSDKLKELDESKRNALLGDLFGRMEAVTAFATLSSKIDILRENIAGIAGVSGSTERAFEAATSSMMFQLRQLSVSFKILLVNIGGALQPLISSLARGLSFIVGMLRFIVSSFPNVSRVLFQTLFIVGLLLTAFGGVAAAVYGAKIAVAALNAQLVALGATMGIVFPPLWVIVAAVAAIAGAVVLMKQVWDRDLGGIKSTIKGFLAPVVMLFTMLKQSWESLSTGIVTIDGATADKMKKMGIFNIFVTMLMILRRVKAYAEGFYGSLKAGAASFFSAISGVASALFDIFKTLATVVFEILGAFTGGPGRASVDAMKGIGTLVGTSITLPFRIAALAIKPVVWILRSLAMTLQVVLIPVRLLARGLKIVFALVLLPLRVIWEALSQIFRGLGWLKNQAQSLGKGLTAGFNPIASLFQMIDKGVGLILRAIDLPIRAIRLMGRLIGGVLSGGFKILGQALRALLIPVKAIGMIIHGAIAVLLAPFRILGGVIRGITGLFRESGRNISGGFASFLSGITKAIDAVYTKMTAISAYLSKAYEATIGKIVKVLIGVFGGAIVALYHLIRLLAVPFYAFGMVVKGVINVILFPFRLIYRVISGVFALFRSGGDDVKKSGGGIVSALHSPLAGLVRFISRAIAVIKGFADGVYGWIKGAAGAVASVYEATLGKVSGFIISGVGLLVRAISIPLKALWQVLRIIMIPVKLLGLALKTTFLIAVAPLKIIWGALKGLFGLFTDGSKSIGRSGGAFSAILFPLWGVIKLIAGAFNILKAIASFIIKIPKAILSAVTSVVTKIYAFIDKVNGNISSFFGGVVKSMITGIVNLFQKLGVALEYVKKTLLKLAGAIKSVTGIIALAFKWTGGFVSGTIGKVGEWGKSLAGVGGGIFGAIVKPFATAFESVRGIFTSFFGFAKSVFSKIGELISGPLKWISGLVSKVAGLWRDIVGIGNADKAINERASSPTIPTPAPAPAPVVPAATAAASIAPAPAPISAPSAVTAALDKVRRRKMEERLSSPTMQPTVPAPVAPPAAAIETPRTATPMTPFQDAWAGINAPAITPAASPQLSAPETPSPAPIYVNTPAVINAQSAPTSERRETAPAPKPDTSGKPLQIILNTFLDGRVIAQTIKNLNRSEVLRTL